MAAGLTIHCLTNARAGDAILLLQQANELIELAGSLTAIVVGEFCPRHFDLAPRLLPFANKYVLIHADILWNTAQNAGSFS
jgi:hypothetical protein